IPLPFAFRDPRELGVPHSRTRAWLGSARRRRSVPLVLGRASCHSRGSASRNSSARDAYRRAGYGCVRAGRLHRLRNHVVCLRADSLPILLPSGPPAPGRNAAGILRSSSLLHRRYIISTAASGRAAATDAGFDRTAERAVVVAPARTA